MKNVSLKNESKKGRPAIKEYEPELLMKELVDTVTEIYHNTNEIKATAMELSFPPNKVENLQENFLSTVGRTASRWRGVLYELLLRKQWRKKAQYSPDQRRLRMSGG